MRNLKFSSVWLTCILNMIFVAGVASAPTDTPEVVQTNSTLSTEDNNSLASRFLPYMQPSCPHGYVLINGLCYQNQQQPSSHRPCPEGYYLAQNMLCYRIVPLPCENTTTSSPAELETSSTVPTEPSAALCPTGSVYHEGRCRKVYCSKGEYYSGRCLQPICPEGTVWRGSRCQPPNFVTTILQIENVVKNQLILRPGQRVVINNNNNNLRFHNTAPDVQVPPIVSTTSRSDSTSGGSFTTRTPPTASTPVPSSTLSPPTRKLPDQSGLCCSIVTPRICKRYGAKWVCFNRRYRRCDPEICKHPLIYLKTPKIEYNPPVLIMPPNPPLQACQTEGCDESDTVDCSGCAHNRREACSPYCYRYMCPQYGCAYVEQEKYCNRYPGEFGCTTEDGCIWDWCGEKCG